MINRRTLLALAAGTVLFVACGDDGGSSAPKIANAWARQSPAATTMGAIYLDVTSSTADTLVKVSVPATVAAEAQLHETVEAMTETTTAGATDTTMGMTETTMAGTPAMQMQPVDKIDLPAKTTVSLEPGGYHIMLMGLVKPLVVGDKIDVTLTFGSGATVTTSVEVRADAP